MTLRAYFDGSKIGSDWKSCDAIALAGFAAGDEVMYAFEKDYAAVLADDRNRPAAPFLHMRELRSESVNSPFSSAKGWNNDRRTRLVDDVLRLLESLDKTRSRLFVCSVDAKAIERLRTSGMDLPSAIRVCNHYCPHNVMNWWAHDYPGIISESHYFFDRNEPFELDFMRLRKLQTSSRLEISGNRETWKLIKTMQAIDSKSLDGGGAPLQIADLLAWGTIRQRTDSQNNFLKGIAVAIKRVVPSSWLHVNEINAAEFSANVPR